MATVTHTQRLILQAVESLTELEDGLRGRLDAPDLMAQLDALIGTLQGLVGNVTQGERGAVQSFEDARQELESEAQVRGRGQQGRLCAS